MPAVVPEMLPPALLLSDVIVPLLLTPSVSLMILPLFTTVSELALFSKAGAPEPLSRPLLVKVFAEPVAVRAATSVDESVPVLVILKFPPDQVTQSVVPNSVVLLDMYRHA